MNGKKRVVKGGVSAVKTEARALAKKKRHQNWLKNKKPTVRGFNPNKPWVINQAGKATNRIPPGEKGRKPTLCFSGDLSCPFFIRPYDIL